jgi:hypothetical protein
MLTQGLGGFQQMSYGYALQFALAALLTETCRVFKILRLFGPLGDFLQRLNDSKTHFLHLFRDITH